MFRAILLLALTVTCDALSSMHYEEINITNPGPLYPATKGEIWPKPQTVYTKRFSYFTVEAKHFTINITGETCEILENAVGRYKHIINELEQLTTNITRRRRSLSYLNLISAGVSNGNENGTKYNDCLGRLERLNVRLSKPCEEYPYLDMDESYNLTVSEEESLLTSESVWGILRGLESFSQLLYLPDDYSEIRANWTLIKDFPTYSHRGLLIDTSRHYISPTKILLILDAMAYNKMNVLHWHIVDDQSFPYVSKRFPNLSERGAYHRKAVYTHRTIAFIVKHARDRGIRVVPEFDVPGHTRSWGEGYPELLTECFSPTGENLGLGPMNPIRNKTYTFLKELFEEVSTLFPDKYVHIGGDEINYQCWSRNPDIMEYMRLHKLHSVSQLQWMFMTYVLSVLPAGAGNVVWQEVVDDGVKLPAGSLVQIWKSTGYSDFLNILMTGHRVIDSSCWYLDHLYSGGDWIKYYLCDPRGFIEPHNSQLAKNIIGGEVCMWSEVVDNNNIMSRIWPRASAAAEKLWSGRQSYTETVARRLEEHTCRMVRRGVPAQPPSGPGFCLTLS